MEPEQAARSSAAANMNAALRITLNYKYTKIRLTFRIFIRLYGEMTQNEFRQTWLPLSDALYRVAFYMLEDEADAKDAVQDFYIKLLAKSPADVLNPKAYAITLMRNMCIDRIRAAQKFFSIECAEDSPRLDFMAGEPDVLATREKLRRVLAIIEGLPDRQREVVRQRIFEEKEYDEISRSTGLTEGNLRVLLSMARKRIRQEYERDN